MVKKKKKDSDEDIPTFLSFNEMCYSFMLFL